MSRAVVLRNRLAVVAVVGGVGLLGPAACSSSHTDAGPQSDEYIVDCEAADGGPSASDENFASFINKEAAGAVVKDDTKAPHLAAPAAGSMLSKTTPPMVSFTVQATAPGARRPTRTASVCPARPVSRRSGWTVVRDLLVLERAAEAHCAAFTGENYLFRLTPEGEKAAVYTATLSVTSFTPDAAIWAKALANRGGQTLTLTLERAVFFKGDIMDGPYAPTAPLTFVVEP